jgi:hypothetical protein
VLGASRATSGTARSLGRRWKEWDWVLGAIDTMEVSVGTVDLG